MRGWLYSSFQDFRSEPDLARLLGLSFVLGLAYSFVVPFLSLFGTEEVGLSPSEFGLFMTTTSLSSIAVSTLLARWSDVRYSRKAILLLGGVAGSLGYIGYALVRNLPVLVLIGSLVLGVASGTFTQLFAYARSTLHERGVSAEKQPLYMNVVRLAFAFAWTVGPALSAWLLTRASFKGAFLVAGLLYGLFALGVALYVRRSPPRAESIVMAANFPLSKALRDPTILSYFFAFCLHHACSTMGMMNLPLLLKVTLRGTDADVGWAYSIAPIFEIPFMFYVGVLATRAPHGVVIRSALGIAALYYGGLVFAPGPSAVFCLQVLSAAVVSVMSGLAITFFQDFMPGQPGTATNLYASAARIGSTGGYLVFGLLTQAWGHRGVFSFCAVATCLSLLLLFIARGRPAVAVAP